MEQAEIHSSAALLKDITQLRQTKFPAVKCMAEALSNPSIVRRVNASATKALNFQKNGTAYELPQKVSPHIEKVVRAPMAVHQDWKDRSKSTPVDKMQLTEGQEMKEKITDIEFVSLPKSIENGYMTRPEMLHIVISRQ